MIKIIQQSIYSYLNFFIHVFCFAREFSTSMGVQLAIPQAGVRITIN